MKSGMKFVRYSYDRVDSSMVALRDGGIWKLFEANRLTEPDIWYVSYRSNIRRSAKMESGGCRARPANSRMKPKRGEFAQQIIEKGWSAIAGTLNPHTRRKRSHPRKFSIGSPASVERKTAAAAYMPASVNSAGSDPTSRPTRLRFRYPHGGAFALEASPAVLVSEATASILMPCSVIRQSGVLGPRIC